MPFTPYHFGPSGFVGLAFKKWLDFPVFTLANVVVDIEVLIYSQWPVHRYAHTLLIGAVVGGLWGVAAYPLRHLFKRLMNMFLLTYKTTFLKMLISGILGVWLHILIDAIYHWDVRIFWPGNARPLFGLISRQQVKSVCLAFFIPVAILYVLAAISYIKQSRQKNPPAEAPV